MPILPNQIPVTTVEQLPPDTKRTAEIYTRLGYTVSEALADLADNSIDAKAKKILIRFVRTADKISRVLIVDDGSGMDDATLKEAMRFGSKQEKGGHKLGKYGIGLKTASLSQAKTVTVLSCKGNRYCGRRWTIDNISLGWRCEILDGAKTKQFLEQGFPPVRIKQSGTVVIWDDLLHFRSTPTTIESIIQNNIRSISIDLGIRFHRFIKDGRIQILVDAQLAGSRPTTIHSEIMSLDPFSYPESGKDGYPKKFSIELNQHGTITLESHIWPPKSKESGYTLGGGKVSARQGFYFYRNDRLIQAGGWNGCRDDDNEPHLSLARIKIDMPENMDADFQLDIKKSHVEPPSDFVAKVSAATQGRHSFKEFIKDALAVYKKQKKIDSAKFPHVPGRGFPAGAADEVRSILHERGAGKPRAVHFSWKELAPRKLFDLNRNRHVIILNKLYRRNILQSGKASSTDAPLAKLLLLFLLQDEIDRQHSTGKYLDWEKRINDALVTAIRHMD